jgi:hypothetical protein
MWTVPAGNIPGQGDDNNITAGLQQLQRQKQLEQSCVHLVNSRPESQEKMHGLLDQSLSDTLQTVNDYQLLRNNVTGAILQDFAMPWEKDVLPIFDDYIYNPCNQQDRVHDAQQWYKVFFYNDEWCQKVQAMVIFASLRPWKQWLLFCFAAASRRQTAFCSQEFQQWSWRSEQRSAHMNFMKMVLLRCVVLCNKDDILPSTTVLYSSS